MTPTQLVYFFSVFRPGKSAARRGGPTTVLLAGPSDAGKTALFAKVS